MSELPLRVAGGVWRLNDKGECELKLAIHAGLHKTASSSFQFLCRAFEDKLLVEGICYQKYDRGENFSYLANALQRGKTDELEFVLRQAASEVSETDTVLISGEDFENCLIDHDLARALEDVAYRLGFDQLEWFFVYRNPLDYLKSIYGEMSKHNVCLNIEDVAGEIFENGYFCVENENYRYKFVFDFFQFFDSFSAVTNNNCEAIEYENFCAPFPGHEMLRRISLSEDYLNHIKRSEISKRKFNTRLTIEETEIRYALNALGIPFSQENWHENKSKLMPLVNGRIDSYNNLIPQIGEKFANLFDNGRAPGAANPKNVRKR